MQIMITNNSNTHSAEKWAEVTANEIVGLIEIDPKSTSSAAQMARNALPIVKGQIAAILVAPHNKVQVSERGKLLATNGIKHLNAKYDPVPYIAEALKLVNEVMAATMFAEAFARPVVQEVVYRSIGNHFTTSMRVEREAYALKSPNAPECKSFFEKHRGKAPLPA